MLGQLDDDEESSSPPHSISLDKFSSSVRSIAVHVNESKTGTDPHSAAAEHSNGGRLRSKSSPMRSVNDELIDAFDR